MKYKLNPVFRKETRLRVRSWKFLMALFVYNFFLILVALFGFEMVFSVHWNAYVDYSGANLVYILLIGLETTMLVFMIPSFTAGSIASEREKQTLDILLTTLMSPEQVIMGKLASSISMVLLLIFSSLPVISVVCTIGGVGLLELIQFVVIMGIIAIFIGSIGVLASAALKKTGHATIISYGVILALCLGTVAIVLLAYLLQQLCYWNVMQGQGNVPNMAWVEFVLMFNPIVTVVDMLCHQLGYTGEMIKLAGCLGKMPSFVVNHWCILSLCVQAVSAGICLRAAVRFLNPLKCSEHS